MTDRYHVEEKQVGLWREALVRDRKHPDCVLGHYYSYRDGDDYYRLALIQSEALNKAAKARKSAGF